MLNRFLYYFVVNELKIKNDQNDQKLLNFLFLKRRERSVINKSSILNIKSGLSDLGLRQQMNQPAPAE